MASSLGWSVGRADVDGLLARVKDSCEYDVPTRVWLL